MIELSSQGFKSQPVVDATACDVVVVGAGFAGCISAISLARQGLSVTLVEASAKPADVFRAEKISGDQIAMLRELGLLDVLKAAAEPARHVINVRGRLILERIRVEEYGLKYRDIIGTLRAALPESVKYIVGRVDDIDTGETLQHVHLHGGTTLTARLVVLASGHSEALRRKLGLIWENVHPQPTVCVGFTLRAPESGFPFPGLCAYGERHGDGVDYLSIFPIDGGMRGNLQMFTDVRDPRVMALRERGMPALLDLIPGLTPWLKDCTRVSDVAIFPVTLARTQIRQLDGVVLVGDAFRTSCPSVGTGLTCALSDAIQLCQHVGAWMATPGMGAQKLESYYRDPVKLAHDRHIYDAAIERRVFIGGESIWRRLRCDLHFAKRALRWRIETFLPRIGRNLGLVDVEGSPSDVAPSVAVQSRVLPASMTGRARYNDAR